MENTIEDVIKDVNTSLPERKLTQLIERTNMSADMKALLVDVSRITVKVAGKVIAIGRKILSFIFDLVKTFPTVTLGVIAALVISALIAGIPLFGPPLAAFLSPLLLALGIAAGALNDFLSNDLDARISDLVGSFGALVEFS